MNDLGFEIPSNNSFRNDDQYSNQFLDGNNNEPNAEKFTTWAYKGKTVYGGHLRYPNKYASKSHHSIAVLVPRGHCTLEEKLQMTLEMNEHIIKSNDQKKKEQKSKMAMPTKEKGLIELLIIYDNRTLEDSTIFTDINETSIKLNSSDQQNQSMKNISFYVLFIKFEDGQELTHLLQEWYNSQHTSYYLESNDLNKFGFPIELSPQRLSLDDKPPKRQAHIVLVCFVLLITPILRAIELWYGAGGRIYFRSQENGDRFGFYYQRPHREWASIFGGSSANHTINQNREPVEENEEIKQKKMLSKEEVLTIPQISYNHETTNISSICSICLEDFQNEETIGILPCQHPYHIDCILPWLTERQSCCPLCKLDVIIEKENEKKEEDATISPSFTSD